VPNGFSPERQTFFFAVPSRQIAVSSVLASAIGQSFV